MKLFFKKFHSMLTQNQVLHIAKLSKIKLKDDQIKGFQQNLSNIFDFISQLNEVNTNGIEPTSQVTGITNSISEDKIQNCKYTDKLLQCTPHTITNHQIKIPKVL